jgi:hypothetical protein
VLRGPSRRDCARALWLLGLEPPVTPAAVATAWRERVARAHPDRHEEASGRRDAAETLTRALNEARDVLVAWIEAGREWPAPLGRRPDPAPNAPSADPDEPRRDASAPRVCPQTGFLPGDRVRVWPYHGGVELVEDVEYDEEGSAVRVRLVGGPSARTQRVRLAAFSCLVCGACAGPAVEAPTLRPCPDCLADLRRLEQDAGDAPRIRRAIETRATAGVAAARALRDQRLENRARSRRRWARLLAHAEPDELHQALLERFSRAYEAWGEPLDTPA